VTPQLSSETVLLTFLLFCRIGTCLAFMPGFSSQRVPVQARLFLAIAVTLTLAPILLPGLAGEVGELRPEHGLFFMITEVTTGMMIGMLGRVFFLALSFAGVALASFAGFSNLPGIPLDSAEPNPTLSAIILTTATVMFFSADLHWEVLRGLIESYAVLPVSAGYDARFGLVQFVDATTKAFLLAVQITAPFIVFSIGINFLFGVMNKFTPQIAVYFISLPFVMMGGLLLLYFTIGELLMVFMKAFGRWMVTG
jgi:flagellar biosynthetic protein FliR